jgi:hypothetical protein
MKMPGEQGYFSEIDALHEADMMILRSNYPFPPKSTSEATNELDRLTRATSNDWAD